MGPARDRPAVGAPLARLERLATGLAGVAFVGTWAFIEAILFPVVPDVGLGLLALVAPRRSHRLFAAVVLGSLLGTAVLYMAATLAPDTVTAAILAVPGIREPMLTSARDLVAAGDPLSIAQLGPGTPLKVYTLAWATGPGTPLALTAGVVLNRITRIGPGLLALVAAGWAAPAFLRRHDRLVLLAYAAFYVVAYVLYLQ